MYLIGLYNTLFPYIILCRLFQKSGFSIPTSFEKVKTLFPEEGKR